MSIDNNILQKKYLKEFFISETYPMHADTCHSLNKHMYSSEFQTVSK